MPFASSTSSAIKPPIRFFAPRKVLLGSAVVAIIFTLFAAFVALQQPWLGISFSATKDAPGLTVVGVDSASLNRERLAPGDVILSLSDANGQSVVLNDNLLLDEPDTLSHFEFGQFIKEQALLSDIIAHSPLATTADGRVIPLHTRHAPLTALLGKFSLHALYALISFFIAIGIWVVRPGQMAASFFAISGFGVLLSGLPLSIYTHRNLVIDAQLFRLLSAFNHAGSLLICASLVSLFWVYPRKLSQRPLVVPALLFVVGSICWVLTQLDNGAGASTTVYLPILLSYGLGLVFAGFQWRASRNHPTDRAALKWCLLAIFTGTVMLIGLITIPPVFGFSPLVPVVVGYAGFLMVYLGLAAGLLRYRLFDIDRWWFKTWLWFAAGLFVVVIDLVLVAFVNMASSSALALSLALSGWLYFPLRQWLWEKLGQRFDATQDNAIRELVDTLFAAKYEEQIVTTWPHLLEYTFRPLLLKPYEGEVTSPDVSNDGVRMLVPALGSNDEPQLLEFPQGGGRLFKPHDLNIIHLLYDLTRKALQGLRAREAGAEMERNRIMRDLHDDLGARLLDLVYASDTPLCRSLALSAIEDLRGLVDAASGDSLELGHLITACEGEARTRLDDVGFSLQWRTMGGLPSEMMVSARVVSNIMRTMRELVTNVIRHADADTVEVTWRAEIDELIVTVADNGDSADPSTWVPGHGTRTINVRVNDLGGRVAWLTSCPHGTQVEVSLPLPL